MTLELEPASTALVLIDLEHGIVAQPTEPHKPADVVTNAVRIADALRASGGTVVFVHVLLTEILELPVDSPMTRGSGGPPPNASDLVPELGVQPGDLVIAKRQWGAFYGTDLEQHLLRKKIKTIIMGGIATNYGVESTARAAFDRGYRLVFAEDAMSGIGTGAHDFSVKNLFPRMGRVRSTREIVTAIGD